MITRPFVVQAAADADDVSKLEPAAIHEQNRPAMMHDLQADLLSGAAASPKTKEPAVRGALPMIQTPGLPEVYEQGGIRVPAHGFSILKVAEMLGSVHVRDLAPDAKRAAILMALEASNIQLADVIEDAARRELALNDYEARQQQTFQSYKAGKQQQNQELQVEIERLIEQLRLRIQENEKELTSEKTRLDEWRTRKREEERRIRTAASLFGVAAQPAAGENASAQRQSSLSDPAAGTTPAGKKTLDGPATSSTAENGSTRPSTRPSLWKR